MTVFSNISKINPDNNKTWKNKTFLTFDIDWAHDEIIEDCYNIISTYSVSTTWYVTHNSKFLNVLKFDKNVELGIHPNFNNLLFNFDNKSSSIVLNEILELVHNPTSVRSHSLTQNERLIDLFRDCGLTHVSNFFIPHCSNNDVTPFFLWDSMIMVPHFWQDNVSIKMKSGFPLNENHLPSCQVYNFHPIHVYLNSSDLNIYEKTRSIHNNPNELITFRHNGYGVRSQLIQLLEASTV